MNKKALKVLEFHKVKSKISEYAITLSAKNLIEELEPFEEVVDVERALLESYDALNILYKKGSPPFEGLYDISEAVIRAEKGGTLNPMQLLRIASAMKCARSFISFVSRKEEETPFYTIEDICSLIIPLREY